MKKQLIILTGAESGKFLLLEGPLFVIGRSGSFTLMIPGCRDAISSFA